MKKIREQKILADNVGYSLIILFTRFPRAGQTKTRLIPHLGACGAALLQKSMAEFTIGEAISTHISLQIHFTGGTKEEMQDWLYEDVFCLKASCQKTAFEEKVCPNQFTDALYENKTCQSRQNIYDQHTFCLNQPIKIDKQHISCAKQAQKIDKQQTDCAKEHYNKVYANLEFISQDEGDLGHKMHYAFTNAFAHAFKHAQDNIIKIILMGSDCPDNRAENMLEALHLLEHSPCVLGPSIDGGYYLIGFSAQDFESAKILCSQVFRDMAWGKNTVFQDTKSRINKYQLLPILSDVDYPADIPVKISVIIPVLNDARHLQQCLELMPRAFNIEIIVVDGKSSDHTCKIAQEFGVILCHSEAGRALQMHEGAKRARGEILFFLHADSRLPSLWDMQIRELMQNNKNSLGYFCFAIEENFWAKNIIVWGTNLRAKFLHLPYGDQGLFVRKKDFETWKMRIIPILEDISLVKKARQFGKISCTNTKLYTSGRRWIKYGIMRTICINQSVLLSASWGMDLQLLRNAYVQGKNPLIIFIRNIIQRGFKIWKK